MKVRNSFSLVELMVVIAIVALLSGISVSLYKDYVTKANVNKAVQTAHKISVEAVEYYNRNGSFSGTSIYYTTAGLKGVSQLLWNGGLGLIEIFFASGSGVTSGSAVLQLIPSVSSDGVISWKWRSSWGLPFPCKYLPPNSDQTNCN